MALPAHAPTDLQPSWQHIPRLAWVAARAFLGERRANRVGGLWAVAPAALIYLPLLTTAALRRHVAASPDSRSVVAVWTGSRDRLTLIGVEVAELAILAGIIDVVTGLALATVTTLTGVIVVTVMLGALFALILLPATVDASAMVVQRWKAKAASAERYTAQLRHSGHTAWAIGPWAAWPPGRHTGTTLVDQLLPEVPPGVWLVAVARDTHIATTLDARGFLTPAGGGLLRVRPPAGQTPPPPAHSPN